MSEQPVVEMITLEMLPSLSLTEMTVILIDLHKVSSLLLRRIDDEEFGFPKEGFSINEINAKSYLDLTLKKEIIELSYLYAVYKEKITVEYHDEVITILGKKVEDVHDEMPWYTMMTPAEYKKQATVFWPTTINF